MEDANDKRNSSGEDHRRLVPFNDSSLTRRRQDSYGPLEYAESSVEDQDDLAATLQYYIRLVLKRKWLISGIALASLILGGVATLMKTPQYSATTRLQIERSSAKIVDGADVALPDSGRYDYDFLQTQYELLESQALAERVVTALQLDADESFLKSPPSLVGMLRDFILGPADAGPEPSRSDLRLWATYRVLGNVSIRPVAGTRLVDISYLDPSPVRAQRIANAYGEAFINSNLDKRFEATSYAKTFLKDQLQQLKIRLEESEQAMLAFAEREKIVQVNEKSSIAESNLAAANAALGKLISERIENEQAWRQLEEAKGIDLPQVLTNRVIDGLRARRNELTRDYEEKLEIFKPSYPTMVQIANKIKEIDRQLKDEVRSIRSSLKAAYVASRDQEAEMKKRIEALRGEVLALQRRSVQHNILKREVDSNRKIYNDLLQRYKQVDIAAGVGTNNVFVVDRAAVPGAPSTPRLGRALMLALALGLGCGFGVAFLIETLDDRIRAPDELEEFSGLAMLGIIPKARSPEHFASELGDPNSASSEAYRSLATALQFSTESGLPRSIALTSSGPAEGKSSTSIALARHFANVGLKVLLIDADLRKPTLHERLQRDNSEGLSNYLTGALEPPEAIQETDHPNLALMTSGPLPPNAADLLAGTRMFSLITVGLEVFDLIIVDAPPLLGLADAQLLTTAASASVFVVEAGGPRKGMIRSALKRLELARVTPLGVVLTKFDSKASGYGYGYGYGYETYAYGAQLPPTSDAQGEPQLVAARAS